MIFMHVTSRRDLHELDVILYKKTLRFTELAEARPMCLQGRQLRSFHLWRVTLVFVLHSPKRLNALLLKDLSVILNFYVPLPPRVCSYVLQIKDLQRSRCMYVLIRDLREDSCPRAEFPSLAHSGGMRGFYSHRAQYEIGQSTYKSRRIPHGGHHFKLFHADLRGMFARFNIYFVKSLDVLGDK